MNVHPSVARGLKRIHPGLFAEFQKGRWHVKKYDIEVNRDVTAPAIILVVENEDGSYRAIDERTYHKLREGRWLALQRLNDIDRELMEADEKRVSDQDNQWDDLLAAEYATFSKDRFAMYKRWK